MQGFPPCVYHNTHTHTQTRLKWHTTGTDPEKVSLPFVHAVVRLLHSQEELAEILARCGYQRRAAAPSIDSDLHTAFLKRVSAAPAISRFTPLELDVLAGMGAGGLRDLVGYVDAVKGDPDVVSSGSDGANVSPLRQSMQAGYNFSLAAVAGAVGATFVYPIGAFCLCLV